MVPGFRRLIESAVPHGPLLLGWVAVAAIALSLAVGLWTSHQRTIATAYTALEKLALATERQTLVVIDSSNQIIDSALQGLALLKAAGAPDQAAIQRLLAVGIGGQTAIRNLVLVDRDGRLVHEARNASAAPAFLGDQEYVSVHRQRTDAGLYLATPMVDAAGELMIPMSRRINGSDGGFDGVIAAFMPAGFVVELYKGMVIGGDATVVLARRDGMMLARQPSLGTAPLSLAASPLFRDHVPYAPHGSYRIQTFIDRVDRLVSYRVSERVPIVVSIAYTTADVLAGWHADLILYLGVSLVCAVAILAITVRLQAGLRLRMGMEQQLRRAQRMEALGKLTEGLAHNFNTHLGVIIGNLDLLEDTHGDDPKARQLIENAMQGANHAAQLTRSLLTFASRQPLDAQAIQVNERLQLIAGLLERALGHDIVLTVDLAHDVWPVQVDGTQFDNAILNLANNARDAMPDGGRLTITTQNLRLVRPEPRLHGEVPTGDHVLITVSDVGSGMSVETAAHALEPFFTTKSLQGTGLGLSMVYGFVAQSGGQITLDSEPGRGTTVRLYLPRHHAAVAPSPTPPVRRGTETVLVVEDNEAMRRTTAMQLARLGYRVLEASDASAALAILERAAPTPDLLFSDIRMPGELDGEGLAHRARARWPDLAILLTSGASDGAAESRRNDPATRPMLHKPYGRDELARAVRTALDARMTAAG